MRIRRVMLIAALGLPACAGIGQAQQGAEVSPPGIDGGGSMLVETSQGIERLDATTGESSFSIDGAVSAPDGRTLYSVVDGELVVVDPGTGSVLQRDRAPSGMEAIVASADGRVALVTEGSPSFPDVPTGRTTTPIAIVDTREGGGNRIALLDLDGNFEPEAFSSDGRKLFVVQYLPAENPNRYRVMMLDPGTGTVSPMPSSDKVPQSSMQGERVQHALSPDGKVLYTLYEAYDRANEGIAFVHVLNLDEKWAHCVDLPIGMAASPPSDKALAMSPDGKHLFVTDAGSGTIVRLATHDLWAVIEPVAVSLPAPSAGSSARAAVSEDGILWVSGGSTLARFQTGDPAQAAGRWTMPGEVRDLFVADDGAAALSLVGDRVVARLAPDGQPGGWVPAGATEQIVSFEPGQ